MIMERLHGVGVDSLLEREGALPVERAVQIIVEAADAIAEANGLGIIHRDVKPSNLYLANDPAGAALVKVLDFGISKRVTVEEGRESASLTAPQTLLGSPQYMSPEQLRDPRSVDGRSDVWGLGVTLYELLTGRVPFECDSIPELCARIFNSTPARVDELQPRVPAALADIIEQCLTKRPEDRVPSVAALVSKLAPFCRGATFTTAEQLARTTRASLDAAPSPSPHARPRSPLVVGAVVALAFGGVALLVRDRSSGKPAATTAASQLAPPPAPSPSASGATVASERSAAPAAPLPDAAPAERSTASEPSASAPNRALPPSPPPPLAPPQPPRGRGLKGIKLMD
jgi:serine/threonine protein kinase